MSEVTGGLKLMFYRLCGAGIAVLVATFGASANSIFVCEFKDGVELTEQGDLSRSKTTESWKEIYSPLEIDTASGVIRQGKSRFVLKMKVIQQGSLENDWVLAFDPDEFPIGLRVTTSQILRIRDWRDQKAPLAFLVDYAKLFSGVCQKR